MMIILDWGAAYRYSRGSLLRALFSPIKGLNFYVSCNL